MVDIEMNARSAEWEAVKEGVVIRSAVILFDLIDALEAMGQRDIRVKDGWGQWIAM